MISLAFRPRLLGELRTYSTEKFRADLLAGVTVGIIAIPLAMAFAIASGVAPEQGLVTAVITGFIISAVGGTRLCIGGPTGAFIVVLYGILIRYGWANLMICTMMAGVILMVMGAAKLGRLIRFVPNSVIIGFTNGIAVLIALSQVKDFLGLPIAKMPGEFFGIVKALWAALPNLHGPSMLLAIACLAFLRMWPAKWSRYIPSPFLVLIFSTLLTLWGNTGIATIGSKFGEIKAAIPFPAMPEFTIEQLGSLIPPAVTIALLGAIESLLCAVVADKQTNDRADANQELIAQGIANVVSPLFGGLAATSAMARTSANIKNGAQTPVAGIVHAITVLVVLLVASPLAKHVPLPALAAILMWVAMNMGEWREFKALRQYTPLRNATLISTFLLTVLFDLTIAVEVGMVLATLLLIKRLTEAAAVQVVTNLAKDPDAPALPLPEGVAGVRLRGALFFGVVDRLEAGLATVPAGSKLVLLDFLEVIYIDSTALETVERYCENCRRAGIEVIVFGLGPQPRGLFARTGADKKLGFDHVVETRRQALDLAIWRQVQARLQTTPPDSRV
ncbi:MAG TPA: SulP family inorganic anion transporter [Casimicrobium huifangae]|jgi:SulP family sulfate permease|uniref:SulP family inorganic anion transporter n=1 Tax=Casimicrobium huifangae TaxID=2591109 RepID=UPI0012EBF78F|nr:SulP family inorganic anion transporter [Casimicrobium huifangae]HQD66284.1 SulP family inorganic anion transporter [Casimicrobium huifangae]